MIRTSFLAAASLSLAACGSAPAATQGVSAATVPARNCFWASNASNFNAIDEHTVYVRVGVKDVYRLDLFNRCLDIDWNHAIVLAARGGGSKICSGLEATLITKGPFGPMRCEIRTVTKLTPEETAALPPKQRP